MHIPPMEVHPPAPYPVRQLPNHRRAIGLLRGGEGRPYLGALGAKVTTAARRGRYPLFPVETLANAYELRVAGKDWHRISLLLGVNQKQIHSAVRQACRTGIRQRLAE